MNLKQTLAELVAIDSVSARTNAPVIDYLAARCASLGFSLQRFPYTDGNGIEKVNLLALASPNAGNSKVELALVGHTDTVPYDPDWTEALQLNEREGKLFGRGACDTKAFIAAALTAIEGLDLKGLRHPLAFLFTADEEIGLIGAKRFADERRMQARFAIVGEPTSLRPMRAGKGYCLAEITVKGREAHSAYPSLGTSAVFGAARLIGHIERIAKELESETHVDFDPPYTTLNVGMVQGGTAKNVIPGLCKFTLEWRPIPGQRPERLLDLLRATLAEENARDSDLIFAVDAARADQGFETSATSELVSVLERLTGNSAGTVAFGTEAAQLAELGAEAVVLGPGNIREAHRTGEFVPVSELETCVKVLRQAIEKFCV
ncbi:MAG TPA: acetylornithine deacetylase [Pyrinomonadaceae bacterium]|jgi:acetylornithine deacetylase|nr:acetylornithine deacetylase [Pyrinomonadaceae bacterium]